MCKQVSCNLFKTQILRYWKIEIKPSTIQGAGFGLFAYDANYPRNEKVIVFRRGDFIAPYAGEEIGIREIKRRYLGNEHQLGDVICPYVVQLDDPSRFDKFKSSFIFLDLLMVH
jgi:hypothetical protein